MDYIIEIENVNEVFDNQNFDYLFDAYKDYYENQINKINFNFINDIAKVLIGQYHLEYYITLNQLIKNNNVDREEYDFYNMKFFDTFLEYAKNIIRVFNEKDLRILNSIIDLSKIFLKNAIDENNFESLLDSFYELKEKLESNKFVLDESIKLQ